ncbi:MAG: Ig-like domain-containing protein [Clostridia bacterium]|nr:Ig-like domain-containing protein [Clostridia bacterium]
MKETKKLIAVLVTLVLVLTCMFSATVVFAEDEDQTEEASQDTAAQEESADVVDSLGGYKGLVAHWKFDGDLKDSSQFANDGVAVGGKNGVTFVDAVLGKGVKLDGKSYIKVKDSNSLDIRDAFTFSFWVYKDDMRKKETMEGGVPYIIKYNEEGYDYPYGVYEWWTMTPGITFCDSDGAEDIHAEKQVDINKWTLVTATYDGETMAIYHNKEMVKSELKSTSLIKSSQPLYIGFGHFMTVDNYFKGVMDDMRIYNKALSYTEVEDLYDDAVADGSGKNLVIRPNKLVAYYKFENNLKDLSGCGNDGFAVKANNFKYVDGIAGKAVRFNGASYIEVKDSDSLDLDRGFTFGMWVYKEKSKNNQPIFAKYGESHNKKETSYKLTDWANNGGHRLELADIDKDVNYTDYTIDNEKYVDGRWYYYTATYNGKAEDDDTADGDANTIKIYIDGKLIKTEEFDGDISNSSGPLWIGGTTDSIYFKGIMDEFRIYNYALTPTQVKELYSMRDGLEVLSGTKAVTSLTMKAKQEVQLKINSLTHLFTVPAEKLGVGKDDIKRLDVSSKAVYKSSNTKVVSVSSTGKLTAAGKGNATVTVTYGSRSQNITIVVK